MNKIYRTKQSNSISLYEYKSSSYSLRLTPSSLILLGKKAIKSRHEGQTMPARDGEVLRIELRLS